MIHPSSDKYQDGMTPERREQALDDHWNLFKFAASPIYEGFQVMVTTDGGIPRCGWIEAKTVCMDMPRPYIELKRTDAMMKDRIFWDDLSGVMIGKNIYTA